MEEHTTHSFKSTLNNVTPHALSSSPQGVTNGARVLGMRHRTVLPQKPKRQRIPLSDTYNAQALVKAHGNDLHLLPSLEKMADLDRLILAARHVWNGHEVCS